MGNVKYRTMYNIKYECYNNNVIYIYNIVVKGQLSYTLDQNNCRKCHAYYKSLIVSKLYSRTDFFFRNS
jgi:hypothetical protein